MHNRITIGVVVKPQGIKGEIKINPMTDDISRFNYLKSVYIDNNSYKITHARIDGSCVILSVDTITNRDMAESLRGKYLEVDRKDAVKPKGDRHYIVDVIGMKAIADGEDIGTISDILNYGAADIYCLKKPNGKTAMFPCIEATVISYDEENNCLYLDKESLMKTMVED